MNLYSGVLSFLKEAERLFAIAAWRNKKTFHNWDIIPQPGFKSIITQDL